MAIEPIPGLSEEDSSVLRAVCGWHVAPLITETVSLLWDGGVAVILPTLRLDSITSVKLDGREVKGFSWDPAGILYLERVGGRPRRALEVTMTHGYETVPLDLLRAAERFGYAAGAMPFATMNVDGVSVGAGSGAAGIAGSDAVTSSLLAPYVRGPLP